MTNRKILLKCAAAVVGLSLYGPIVSQATEPTRVVATFSILGDMAKRIGGKHLEITTLVGPGGDAHVYKPTPAAARAVSNAGVLVVNGLEFEGWLDRLIDASDFNGTRSVATKGVEPIAFEDNQDTHTEGEHHDDRGGKHHDDHGEEHHDDHGEEHAHHHGVFDPHAWLDLHNAIIYVDNITVALAQVDPDNAATFYKNRAAYVAEIQALDAEIHKLVDGLPNDRRTVVTSHDAFQYFGRTYGLTFVAPQGLSTDSEASAKGVARLIERIRAEGISAVFVENIADPRLLQQIANETDATIGGTLYPGALSGPDGPAPTYLDMMRHNARTLVQALGS